MKKSFIQKRNPGKSGRILVASTSSVFAMICLLILSFNTIGAFGQGATTPFKSIEAETGTLGGGVIMHRLTALPATGHPTPELEASGRAFVELNATGESVSWVNNTDITSNTIVVRASIPDAPTGGGIDATLDLYIDGVFRQALNFASRYSWQYGAIE